MATGDGLKNTKAIAAAVIGFLAPGASYLIGVSSDGVSGHEWLIAGLTMVITSGVSYGVVQQLENKPKDV